MTDAHNGKLPRQIVMLIKTEAARRQELSIRFTLVVHHIGKLQRLLSLFDMQVQYDECNLTTLSI
jgi:hypothetical protein